MGAWTDALAVVGSLGTLGATIDLLIGRAGQQRCKELLETWWLTFSYVTWRDFGKAEAKFAVSVIDRLAGSRILSWKRILVCVSCTILAILAPQVLKWSWGVWDFGGNAAMIFFPEVDLFFDQELFVRVLFADFLVSFASINIALSTTRFISILIGRHANLGLANILFMLLVVIGQYLLFLLWRPFMSSCKAEIFFRFILHDVSISGGLWGAMKISLDDIITRELPAALSETGLWRYVGNWTPSDVLDLSVLFARYLIVILFLASFTARGLQKYVSHIWLQIIESSVPFFTLAFNTIGGLATLVKTVVEHW